MRKISQNDASESALPILTYRNTTFNNTFVDKLAKLKKPKAMAVNYHIKMATNREQYEESDKFEEKINNSLQVPLSMTHRKSPSLNPNTTTMDAIWQSFFPSQKPQSGNQIRTRQKSMQSQKSGTSTNSKQVRKERQSQFENSYHLQAMKKLQQNINQENLQKRLSMFSKESGKNFIRVYKEDIHKIIQHRYSKDRITTFLDTEYIEDFHSVLKTLGQLTSLKRDQMLVFCFLIIDQNKDGLITVQDLLSLLGIKSKCNSQHNALITEDVIKIYDHVQKMKQKGDPVMDTCSNEVLKDECLTFMKYRINNFKQRKQQSSGEATNKYFLSCRMHPHLYTLRHRESQLERLEEKVNFSNVLLSLIGGVKHKKQQFIIRNEKKFAINFQRFSEIFSQSIPKIFLDFLYLMGGIEIPGEQYLKVDNSVLQQPQVQQNIVKEEENKMKLNLNRLEKMLSFNKNFKIFKIKTEP